MYGFIAIMATHPDLQQKLQQQIDDIIGSSEVHMTFMQEMPLLEAAILELLRYMSITPLLLPHQTTRNTSIASYPIPKHTQVNIHTLFLIKYET